MKLLVYAIESATMQLPLAGAGLLVAAGPLSGRERMSGAAANSYARPRISCIRSRKSHCANATPESVR